MAWIFQGNPKRFDIDDYLSRYPELIYWRVPRFAARIAVGDQAYLWRAGPDSGLIASGHIVEAPVPADRVQHPEALGDDLWFAEPPAPDELKVGIRLLDIRLTPEEGMLSRHNVKENALFEQSSIIKMPNGTVFPLAPDEADVISRLWGGTTSDAMLAGVSEGQLKLRSHYRRERSALLTKQKLRQFIREHGHLFCELCQSDAAAYPGDLGVRTFEVHHLSPLATARRPVRTTLDQLAVICASCHRAVHATSEPVENFRALSAHFGSKSNNSFKPNPLRGFKTPSDFSGGSA